MKLLPNEISKAIRISKDACQVEQPRTHKYPKHTRFFEYKGRRMSTSELVAIAPNRMTYTGIALRLAAGWSVEDAVTKPFIPQAHRKSGKAKR